MSESKIKEIREWAESKLLIAKENTGPVDDYGYQRDCGVIEVLEELLDLLNTPC